MRTKLTILGSVAIGFSLTACADEPVQRPPIEQLREGLTIVDASDPSVGVVGAFRKGDQVVYFETKVGPLKPQLYRDTAPDEPANEMDLRFVDKRGETFYVQRGGDEYVDPSWNDDINAYFTNENPVLDRSEDFALAEEAGRAFAAAAAPDAAMVDHVYQFRQVANGLPRMPPPGDAVVDDQGYASWSGSGSYYLQGDLYSKNICFLWVCGKHSGVAMWTRPSTSSTWTLSINACNHGQCPCSNCALSYNCSSTSGGTKSNPALNGERTTSTGTVSGGCNTGYDWWSGGNDHLCNDDSAYELWQIKRGNTGSNTVYGTGGGNNTFTYTGTGNGGDCGGNCTAYYACKCSNNNSCDNDWARPLCP